VLRHLLAPVSARAADAIGVARTLADQRGVALTFDDGPHPDGTPAILEILARAGHKAVFFMVGEQVERRPELAREVASQGHLVALHGQRHRLQVRLTERELALDLERGSRALEDALGRPPEWHRPPYGVYSPVGLRLAKEAGLRPLLWSRWGKDWRRLTTPQRIATRASANLNPGDVILLHDADFYSSSGSYRRTAAALALIVRELKLQKTGTVLPL
jgi:peptidoglycan-N-acetylglucosamine deacetylase